MKTQLMILSVLAISATACGQKVSEADEPQPVKTAFMKQFPKAEHARWEMETMTEFEVNFKQGAETHDRAFAELLFDLGKRGGEGLGLVVIHLS